MAGVISRCPPAGLEFRITCKAIIRRFTPARVGPKRIFSEIQSAWYERTISIPRSGPGGASCLDLGYLNSYAVVYVDGRKVGELRFPGGQVDLSAAVRPGATHGLSLLVVAMPLKARDGVVQ